jgi:carboxylesterase type B
MAAASSEVAGYSTVLLITKIGRLQARRQRCQAPKSGTNIPASNTPVDIISCLNIPFGHIPYRWASPLPVPVPWEGVRDCTKFGPQCPQANEPLFAGHNLPVFGNLETGSHPVQGDSADEFECLNLNIFSPMGTSLDDINGAKKLPVIVWAHGGAYWTGCGGIELYGKTRICSRCIYKLKLASDASEIVARSVRLGSPVIVVTFNYRLGVLGFLHSRELALDAQSQSGIPPEFRATGNLGIVDTYRVFEWVG